MSKARRCKAAKTEEPRLRHQAAECSKEIVQAYLAPVAAVASLTYISRIPTGMITDSDTSQWLGPYVEALLQLFSLLYGTETWKLEPTVFQLQLATGNWHTFFDQTI